jgi:hypothetical protein
MVVKFLLVWLEKLFLLAVKMLFHQTLFMVFIWECGCYILYPSSISVLGFSSRCGLCGFVDYNLLTLQPLLDLF